MRLRLALLVTTLALAGRAAAAAEEPAVDDEQSPLAPAKTSPAAAPLSTGELPPAAAPPATADLPPTAPPPAAGELPPTEPPPRPPAASVGLDPTLPQFGSDVDLPPTTGVEVARGYRVRFHGYLRAPLRVGLGPRNDRQSGWELHAPARIPDLSFTNWQYLDNMPGPWAELFFTYENQRVSASLSIAGYNQTVAGYRELQAQLGINQAFVTARFPETFGRWGGLSVTVGSFTNRYGTAGRYDAGYYETYLFGRTRAAGETTTADLVLSPDLRLVFEHGVGAKLDVIPFEAPMPRPEYLPYPGPVPQGSTFIHHAHAALAWKTLRLGTHYLTSWSPDDRNAPNTTSTPGRMTVTGGELRVTDGVWGHGYLGYSHIDAKDVLVLSDALDVLHSSGGWQFKNNYFGRFDPRTGMKPPDDSGTVDTLLFQYNVSIGAIARRPRRFWGNGPDLVLAVFGMYNWVDSATQTHQKAKFGGEATYTPLSWLGIGARYDLVQPNMSDSDESFSVLSPRLVLRTAFLTHERIILQYSRYFLGREAYAAHPYNELPKADEHAFMLAASMWW